METRRFGLLSAKADGAEPPDQYGYQADINTAELMSAYERLKRARLECAAARDELARVLGWKAE